MSALPDADAPADPVGAWAARFEAAWRDGGRPAVDDYLPPDAPLRGAVLVELVHLDLEFRLGAGEAVRLETYLRRYPELARDRRVVLDLIATECEQRQRLAGPTVEEYLQRFPQYRADLVLDCEPRLVCGSGRGPQPAKPWAPPAGETGAPPPELTRLGKFQLLRLLGSGAFGSVYKAWDSELERVVALKLPRPGAPAEAEGMERFVKEARSAARLQHPGVVALYEAGQVDGTWYIASEFVEGTTLADRCRRGPLPPREAADVLAATAEALHYAHQKGVIHRDIKPSNILLDAEGRPHLADFGLAKRDKTASAATLTGQVLGTPAYMSPEQARGDARKADARSDVYSLGVVLYQLLTGDLPSPGANLVDFVRALEADPVPPRRRNPAVPRDLENVCLRAMSRAPGRRYATAAAFALDLRRFLAGWPVNARPVSPLARLGRWCRRRLLVPLALIALQLLLLLATVAVTVLWLGTTPSPRPGAEPERRARPTAPAPTPGEARPKR